MHAFSQANEHAAEVMVTHAHKARTEEEVLVSVRGMQVLVRNHAAVFLRRGGLMGVYRLGPSSLLSSCLMFSCLMSSCPSACPPVQLDGPPCDSSPASRRLNRCRCALSTLFVLFCFVNVNVKREWTIAWTSASVVRSLVQTHRVPFPNTPRASPFSFSAPASPQASLSL